MQVFLPEQNSLFPPEDQPTKYIEINKLADKEGVGCGTKVKKGKEGNMTRE